MLIKGISFIIFKAIVFSCAKSLLINKGSLFLFIIMFSMPWHGLYISVSLNGL